MLKIDPSIRSDQLKYNKDYLMISASDDAQKQRLLKIDNILRVEVETSEHSSIQWKSNKQSEKEVHKIIIFGVSLELSELEICEDTKATEAKRLMKTDRENRGGCIPTETVILSYDEEP